MSPQEATKQKILLKILSKKEEKPNDLLDILIGSASMYKKDVTPVKGKDYFTPEEINEFKKSITPIKGIHYFDGEKGEKGNDGVSNIPGPKGEKGDPGKDAELDEEKLVRTILKRIKVKDGKDADEEKIIEAVLEKLPKPEKKKLKVSDIEDLENRFNLLSTKIERNYGGHGGTMKNITTTLVSGGLYNLSFYPILGEMEVYVGGGRLFFENGDYTTTQIGGNKVSQINLSLSAQTSIADGAQLNVRGK